MKKIYNSVKTMDTIRLFKFSLFFVFSCFLSAMSLELKNSIDRYEDLFSKFSMEDSGVQISLETIDSLLSQGNLNLSKLKESNISQAFDPDDFSDDDCCDETDDISLQYESDLWFLGKLKELLSDPSNEGLFKELHAIASNSLRYHCIMVKFIKRFRR